jgi:hypothetical protein
MEALDKLVDALSVDPDDKTVVDHIEQLLGGIQDPVQYLKSLMKRLPSRKHQDRARAHFSNWVGVGHWTLCT